MALSLFWLSNLGNEYAPFSFLGVIGAVFANATGAGGGVVFIPAFQQLGLTESQSVATSFAIQCCGMTTGALAWWFYSKTQRQQSQDWRLMWRLIGVVMPATLVGLWGVYGFGVAPVASLGHLFAGFSIVLGLALFATMKRTQQSNNQYPLSIPKTDQIALILISLFGGVITAWLSVGIGEFVAFYLILRGYRITLAIAVAVIISALTVWAGVGYHISAGTIYWDVLMFAGPGAILGAILAKQIATHMPVLQLKMFFAGWIFVAGVFELVS